MNNNGNNRPNSINNSINNPINNMWSYLLDKDNIMFETNKLIEKTDIIRNTILSNPSNVETTLTAMQIIDVLADNFYEYRSFHKLCKLFRECNINKHIKKEYSKADELLTLKYEEKYEDIKMYNKLIEIKKEIKSKEEIAFIDYLCTIYGRLNSNNAKMYKKIILFENHINKKIIRDSEKYGKSNKPINKDHIQYFLRLIKLRNNYAKRLNYDNYQLMLCDDDNDIDTVKQIIKKLLGTYGLNQQNIQQSESTKFNVDKSLNIIFDVFKSWFNLEFVENNQIPGWNKSVRAYNIILRNNKHQNNQKIIGYLYIDIVDSDTECSINSTMLYEACKYPIQINTIKTPVSVIYGTYNRNTNVNELLLRIVRSFGKIINGMFYRTTYIAFDNNNRELFMENLCEHIFINDVLNDSQCVIEKTKYDCFMTLLDLMIHGSYEEQINNEQFLIDKIGELSLQILNLDSTKKITDLNKIISQLINDGGKCHKYILYNLIAHKVFMKLKANKSNITIFIDRVLADNKYNDFRNLISTFISTDDSNNQSNNDSNKDSNNDLNNDDDVEQIHELDNGKINKKIHKSKKSKSKSKHKTKHKLNHKSIKRINENEYTNYYTES